MGIFQEMIIKDIESFRFCLKQGVKTSCEYRIYSNYDYEISSINHVARLSNKNVSDFQFDDALNIFGNFDISPEVASLKIMQLLEVEELT